ncbi:transmembrane protein 56 [Stylonychia lemnae]|uniref:Transmembrane protein 56 n=1 Tax=Stylonychia lemnae TaxID=5949 RepID=A0A078AFQ6_STYLE|nr:transmembrane protein 56 [Stylonychia lemnae]|eukprot:CDW79738.1 transmembrane protein 56 [Stylonychia lemnae]
MTFQPETTFPLKSSNIALQPSDQELYQFTFQWVSILMVIWFTLFTTSKYYIKLPKSWNLVKPFDQLMVRHRIVSCFHGIAANIFGLIYYAKYIDTTCGKSNTYFETVMLANTFTFLASDLLFMLINGFLDIGNLIHHMLGLTSYSYSLYLQRDALYICLNLLPAEISNIQMNTREIFRKIGMRYTKTYFHNEFQYLIIYLLARVFWIPSILYPIFTCDSSNWIIRTLYIFHVVQSWYYCSQMVTLLKQRINEVLKLNKLNMKMSWFEGLSETELEKVGIKHYSNFKA